MYSDAGFDVSKCGRFLALCELDTATASGFAATAAAPAGGPLARSQPRARRGQVPPEDGVAATAFARAGLADRRSAQLPLRHVGPVLAAGCFGPHRVRGSLGERGGWGGGAP